MNEYITYSLREHSSIQHMAGEAYCTAEMLDKEGVPRSYLCSDGIERSLTLWGRVLMLLRMKQQGAR